MVNFDADLTDPPGVSTNNITGSAMQWVGYVVIAILAFAALAVGQQGAGWLQNRLSDVLGTDVGDGSTIGVGGGGL